MHTFDGFPLNLFFQINKDDVCTTLEELTLWRAALSSRAFIACWKKDDGCIRRTCALARNISKKSTKPPVLPTGHNLSARLKS